MMIRLRCISQSWRYWHFELDNPLFWWFLCLYTLYACSTHLAIMTTKNVIVCVCVSRSVRSNSLWAYRLQTTRLLCPWSSLGKNTRVDSHSLLQEIFPTQRSKPGLLHCRQILYLCATREMPISHSMSARSLQSWLKSLWPYGPCSLPGFIIHGILQGIFPTQGRTFVFCTGRRVLLH